MDLYDLFTNTKSDLGARPEAFKVVCDDDAHAEFVSLNREDQERLGYERMLHQKLRSLVQQCNRIVSRNKEKLRQEIARNAKQSGGSTSVHVDPAQNLSQDQLQICAEMMVKVAELEEDIVKVSKQLFETDDNDNTLGGSEGSVVSQPPKLYEIDTQPQTPGQEQVQKKLSKTEIIEITMKKILETEMLRDQISAAKRSLCYIRGDLQTDKTVCEVSGNFMSSRDADERIAAHFAGKQYVGWKMVRDKLKQLDEKYKNMPAPPRAGWGGPPPRRRSRSPDRSDRHNGRGGGGSDWGRDRDRGRGGGYSGGPPSRDSHRQRGSGYDDRDRGYGRDRRRW